MKKRNTSIQKKRKFKIEKVNKSNHKSTPRIGINMSEEQLDLAQKIKNDILELYEEGNSIRTITNHYNDLYSSKNNNGDVLKEAISRETVRKIINNKEVSLKSIIGIVNF